MSVLTEDANRLCAEIGRMRQRRGVLISQLEQAARERRNAISGRQAAFAQVHEAMARTSRADRKAFTASLKQTIAALQQEVQADLSGVRRAWSGPSPAERRVIDLERVKLEQAEAGESQAQEKLAAEKQELEKQMHQERTRKNHKTGKAFALETPTKTHKDWTTPKRPKRKD